MAQDKENKRKKTSGRHWSWRSHMMTDMVIIRTTELRSFGSYYISTADRILLANAMKAINASVSELRWRRKIEISRSFVRAIRWPRWKSGFILTWPAFQIGPIIVACFKVSLRMVIESDDFCCFWKIFVRMRDYGLLIAFYTGLVQICKFLAVFVRS